MTAGKRAISEPYRCRYRSLYRDGTSITNFRYARCRFKNRTYASRRVFLVLLHDYFACSNGVRGRFKTIRTRRKTFRMSCTVPLRTEYHPCRRFSTRRLRDRLEWVANKFFKAADIFTKTSISSTNRRDGIMSRIELINKNEQFRTADENDWIHRQLLFFLVYGIGNWGGAIALALQPPHRQLLERVKPNPPMIDKINSNRRESLNSNDIRVLKQRKRFFRKISFK